MYFFKPFANIFLVFLATFVKIDTRFIVSDPTFAKIAKFTTLRLPIVRPGTIYTFDALFSIFRSFIYSFFFCILSTIPHFYLNWSECLRKERRIKGYLLQIIRQKKKGIIFQSKRNIGFKKFSFYIFFSFAIIFSFVSNKEPSSFKLVKL